ncbi:FecR family protein [Rhodocyclus tenuis]|uniref:Transmembrane sensor n=1 Tax=Rhodocyclus tenuis TaxID=1066 RepID=A0A840G8D0_RHOTE|nr:FecR domain-containing protein [Rhodocyclus tenuis]MBB4247681.1 transmembrane sensor [Rhodocyclus tenuis]
MPAGEQSCQRLFKHALLLVVRQHGAAPAAAADAARELAAWRQRDPAHESACQAALAAWQQTDARMLRDEFALPPSPGERKRQTRRRLTALLGFGGLALLTGHLWLEPSFTLRASTGQARIETHVLPDDSRLDLAPRSDVAISYYRNRRLANLLAGEVRFDVAPDAQRPFEIETRHGRARVLGTAFSVRVLDDGLRVAVAHGRVAVWRAGQPADARPDTELGAGDAVFVTSTGELQHSRVAPDDIGAWRQGWLVFDGIPLDQAVERWNDYLSTPLAIEQRSALANMRLTGSFPIDNPLAFLEALPRIHPVEVVAQGDGHYLIRQRPTASRNEK